MWRYAWKFVLAVQLMALANKGLRLLCNFFKRFENGSDQSRTVNL